MSMLAEVVSAVRPISRDVLAVTQRRLDAKTKPRRSLGRLEDLACRIAAIQGPSEPRMGDKAIVVMGADHGVTQEGVSAYPQEVTGQMLQNIAGGGAAISVLARQAGARVVVVDMGVTQALPPGAELRTHRIGPGTGNFVRGPAMARAQALEAIDVGLRIAGELALQGVSLLGIGDMGIGNTTASSALAAVLTQTAPGEVTGRGTGIDDAGLQRKLSAVERAIARNVPDPADPIDVLSKLGGFEIAGLCGVVLGSAAKRLAVIVDGFIASVAALCALRICPAVTGYLIASHRSAEAGHGVVLAAMGQRPLLDLELRLGEGTGAALAMGLVDASLRLVNEMATFESAGISAASTLPPYRT